MDQNSLFLVGAIAKLFKEYSVEVKRNELLKDAATDFVLSEIVEKKNNNVYKEIVEKIIEILNEKNQSDFICINKIIEVIDCYRVK